MGVPEGVSFSAEPGVPDVGVVGGCFGSSDISRGKEGRGALCWLFESSCLSILVSELCTAVAVSEGFEMAVCIAAL